MRKLTLAAAVVAALGVLSTISSATAESVVMDNVSASDLKSACDEAGGNFAQNPPGYSCVNDNCDGKGGSCSVFCFTDTPCLGDTPERKVTGGSISGIAGVTGVLRGASNDPKQPATRVPQATLNTGGMKQPAARANPVQGRMPTVKKK